MRARLYWEQMPPDGHHAQALRQGDWKLLRFEVQSRNPRTELYQPSNDPGEAHDLAAENPERVAEPGALMDAAHDAHPASPLLFGELDRRGQRPRRR